MALVPLAQLQARVALSNVADTHLRLPNFRRSWLKLRCISAPMKPRIGTLHVRVQSSQSTANIAKEEPSAEEDVCELVSGTDLILGSGAETFDGYFVQAIKNNNEAGVLMLTDVYGFEDRDNRDFAYRLACFGYNVLVPDLFRGVPWSKDRSQSEYEQWRELHPPARVAEDINVATNWLSERLSESSSSLGKLAIIGFCFGGGRLIETLAKDSEGKFTAAVFFYGTRFDTSLATQIKIPVLLISGDSDPLCPVDVIQEIERHVKGSKVRIYAGEGHAFVHHPNSVEEDEAAEDAFVEMKQWLHDKLL